MKMCCMKYFFTDECMFANIFSISFSQICIDLVSTRYVRICDMYITRLIMCLIYVNVMYKTQMYMCLFVFMCLIYVNVMYISQMYMGCCDIYTHIFGLFLLLQ